MATIRDVARESQVSIATVSRVFNNSSSVSARTRERVLEVAARLGYWPNGIARSLITNRTHTLGVLLPDLHGEFFSEVIHGIDAAARSHGFHLLVSRASAQGDDLNAALRSMRGRVDGLVVMAPDVGAADTLRQVAPNTATVLLNAEHSVPLCDSIGIDNVDGAMQVTRHLIGLGHRRIATIMGPERNADARQRLDGFRRALAEAGLRSDPLLEIQGDFTEPSGYDAALELVSREVRPTAVFVANDHMCLGVLGALQDAHVAVPTDLAVVAFDDIPMARYVTPPLTTIHVDMMQLGRRAVDLLLDPTRAERPERRHELLPTTLVVRGSCGATSPKPGEASRRWDRSRPESSSRS